MDDNFISFIIGFFLFAIIDTLFGSTAVTMAMIVLGVVILMQGIAALIESHGR